MSLSPAKLEWQRQSRRNDPTKTRNASKRYRLAHPEKCAEQKRVYRSTVRGKKTRADHIATIARAVFDYKCEHPCVDCGESDFRCLDFDHRDRKTKCFTLAHAVTSGKSLKTIMNEVAKCNVRCANCHRKKTFGENLEIRL